jgi:hypothetical protein
MYALLASELLDIWEQGLAQPSGRRALTLLAAACPDTPPDALARLSIGQRDGRLLRLREWTFGPQLVGLATCPGCSERLELTFNVSDIRMDPETEAAETLSLNDAGYEVHFRVPNSLDMEFIAASKDLTTTRHILLDRCILSAQISGKEKAIDQLPADVVDAVVEEMAKADPQADVQLALSCSSCGHQWQAIFDIVSFFWSEINVWAHRILREVHVLASAYGWTEIHILALSPGRRRSYMEMVSR